MEKVKWVHADGLGAIKDGCEAWTKGQRAERLIMWVADTWGH
jgi:hypothetical protein